MKALQMIKGKGAPRCLGDSDEYRAAAAAENAIRTRAAAANRERDGIIAALFAATEQDVDRRALIDERAAVALARHDPVAGKIAIDGPARLSELRGLLEILAAAARMAVERRREVALKVGLEIVERDFRDRHRSAVVRLRSALAALDEAIRAEADIRAEAMAASGADLLPPMSIGGFARLGDERDMLRASWERRTREYCGAGSDA